jgi:hypothetical protein
MTAPASGKPFFSRAAPLAAGGAITPKAAVLKANVLLEKSCLTEFRSLNLKI